MRNQRAFGLAGGAAGVDQQRRVIGQGHVVDEEIALARQRLAPDDVALGRIVHRQQVLQFRAVAARRAQLWQAGGVGNGRDRAAVFEPVLERVAAEEDRQWHRHGAELVDGDVGDGCFGPLRHHDGHAVAGLHALACQGVGQAVGLQLQRAVAQRAGGAVFALPVHGHTHGAGGIARPAPAADVGDVEVLRHAPAKCPVQFGPGVGGNGFS